MVSNVTKVKEGIGRREITIDTLKYTNHTKKEIIEYLKNVKNSISKNNFIVCKTQKNEKNKKFIEKYKCDSNKQKQMLLELNENDFCYSVDNYNNPKERLYIFCREYELNEWGTLRKVEVYIKIAVKSDSFTVIISFHEPEKKIKKLF